MRSYGPIKSKTSRFKGPLRRGFRESSSVGSLCLRGPLAGECQPLPIEATWWNLRPGSHVFKQGLHACNATLPSDPDGWSREMFSAGSVWRRHDLRVLGGAALTWTKTLHRGMSTFKAYTATLFGHLCLNKRMQGFGFYGIGAATCCRACGL